MAVHGIGDVAHGDHAHTVKPFARGGGVDVRDAVERRADGNEGCASRVREADAQCRGAAAAAVVRGAAAEAEHDAPRAARKRVGDELSDAVGRGDTGIFASGNERESRCRSHFNDRRAIRQQAVGCVDRLAVGILHAGDAAVRHVQRADLAGGEEERDALARDGADVAARQRALEGIGDHDALFHALCLPCGCFPIVYASRARDASPFRHSGRRKKTAPCHIAQNIAMKLCGFADIYLLTLKL